MTFETEFVSVAKLIAQPEHPNLAPQRENVKKPFEPQDIDTVITALNPSGELADEPPLRKKRPLVHLPAVLNTHPKSNAPKPPGRTLGLKVRQVEPASSQASKPLPSGRTLGVKRKQLSDGPLYQKEPLAKKRKTQSNERIPPEEEKSNTENNSCDRAEDSIDQSPPEEQELKVSAFEDTRAVFKAPEEPAKKRETADVSTIDVAELLRSNAVDSLSIPQLKALLKSVKLTVSGKKQDLVERVKNNSDLFAKNVL